MSMRSRSREVVLRATARRTPDDEGVVAEAAVELERREVVEDAERVVAGAAVGHHRVARAVAEPAAGGLDGGEDVLCAIPASTVRRVS
jgi:hypothetical protein